MDNEEVSRLLERYPNGPKVYFQTLGCKVNSYETDAVRILFESRGFRTTTDPRDCDVCVVNTCTVTAEADRKSGQMLRRAKKLAPRAVVAAMGCRTEMRKAIDEADVCVGTVDRAGLVDLVISRLFERSDDPDSVLTNEHRSRMAEFEDFGPVISREGTRAFVKIQDGCDNYCSYCIIPYARGRSRSRSEESILHEIRCLGEEGYIEIVLTGINLGAFGKDSENAHDALTRLLKKAESTENIRRIRLGSIEPQMIDEAFVRTIAESSKICRHLHVSLQSGSDSVLLRMNRKYNIKHFAESIALLRESMPNIHLSTDIIVGFPAETESEHRESLLFCEQAGFSKIHVFPYSVRAGTVAADMQPKIDSATKSKRKGDFLRLSEDLHIRAAEEMLGKIVSVLVEEQNHGMYSGYSKEYFRVIFSSGSVFESGSEAQVQITGLSDETLTGIAHER